MHSRYKNSSLVLSLSSLVLMLSACGGSDTGIPPGSSASNIWPVVESSIKKDPVLEQRITQLLSTMTVEEKVGQMLQPELKQVGPADVKTFHVGSILNGGGTFPNSDKYASAADWVVTAQSYYQASMDDTDGSVAIPIMWGTDAVHGHNNVLGATLFPHNIGLGAANNPELIKSIAAITAAEVAATGIDWIFAPTVATVRNDLWGRTYEGYSESPEIIHAYAAAMVAGIQGEAVSAELFDDRHLIATAKHFIGDGGTTGGLDRGDNAASELELFNLHGQGYVSAIATGVQTVMASFNSWRGETIHGSHYLLTEVLKQRMGFDGLVVSDWNGHSFIDGCSTASCPQAINAGVDILMAPEPDWRELHKNTVAEVRQGLIPMSRIDDAVTRILRVKLRAGLFDSPPSERVLAGRDALIGAQAHRDIARQAVRESLVLLKNKNNLLPLDRRLNVLVAGDSADNIGKQSGGWSLTWQGTDNTNADFPGGSSIYSGIEKVVSKAGGQAVLSEDGSYQVLPDVAIVVFGEEPYAEGQGDIKSLEFQPRTHKDLALLKKLKSEGIAVVSVFLSGRPLWVNAELNASDAFVVAWLPGTEGDGIAQVLFRTEAGHVNYDFDGRLSFSWPQDISQTNLNRDDEDYDPLFPYGFGLSYDDIDTLSDQLSEQIPADYIAAQALTPLAVAKMPVDFESDEEAYEFSGFDGGRVERADNPDSNHLNNSAKVGKMQKFAGQSWGGAVLPLNGYINFSGRSVFTVKVWSARPVSVLLKLEGLKVERVVDHDGASAWQTLSFDFTGDITDDVTALTLIFDKGIMGDAEDDEANWTFYFDDIALAVVTDG